MLKYCTDHAAKAKLPSDAMNFGFRWNTSMEGLEFWKKEYIKAIEYEDSKY